jgi:hypothetical protein
MKAIVSVVSAGTVRTSRTAYWALMAWLSVSGYANTFGQAMPVASPAPSVPLFVNGIRPQDEIVVVNVRALCGTCDSNAIRSALAVENFAVNDSAGRRQWVRSDLQGFASFDPSVRTIFFVHGNQIESSEAKNDGLNVYRRLLCYGANDERIRFVIFSWPSARVGGLLRDVQEKAARTAPAGCELAWVIDQLPAETPVSLLGFSFGSRIITGSLHILAGGSLGSLRLNERLHPNRAPVNVVLMGTAMHAYWLGEGQYHGRALSLVDEAFFVNSCNDPAMRWYHLSVPGRGGPQALGLAGPTNLSAEQRSKVTMRDVGSRHDLYMYMSARGVTAQIWDHLTDASTTSLAAN